jgi:hypothetical protein
LGHPAYFIDGIVKQDTRKRNSIIRTQIHNCLLCLSLPLFLKIWVNQSAAGNTAVIKSMLRII